jgi:hypothetical protein
MPAALSIAIRPSQSALMTTSKLASIEPVLFTVQPFSPLPTSSTRVFATNATRGSARTATANRSASHCVRMDRSGTRNPATMSGEPEISLSSRAVRAYDRACETSTGYEAASGWERMSSDAAAKYRSIASGATTEA